MTKKLKEKWKSETNNLFLALSFIIDSPPEVITIAGCPSDSSFSRIGNRQKLGIRCAQKFGVWGIAVSICTCILYALEQMTSSQTLNKRERYGMSQKHATRSQSYQTCFILKLTFFLLLTLAIYSNCFIFLCFKIGKHNRKNLLKKSLLKLLCLDLWISLNGIKHRGWRNLGIIFSPNTVY